METIEEAGEIDPARLELLSSRWAWGLFLCWGEESRQWGVFGSDRKTLLAVVNEGELGPVEVRMRQFMQQELEQYRAEAKAEPRPPKVGPTVEDLGL